MMLFIDDDHSSIIHLFTIFETNKVYKEHYLMGQDNAIYLFTILFSSTRW